MDANFKNQVIRRIYLKKCLSLLVLIYSLFYRNDFFFKDFFFFNVDHFYSLYQICNTIASALCFGFLTERHVGSSLTRDQTHTSYIGRWNLNHWTSWEVTLRATFDFFLLVFTFKMFE